MFEGLTENIKPNTLFFSVGSTAEGIVVAKERSALYVDLGSFGTGIIFGREYFEAKDIIKTLKIGDKIFAKIVEMENDQGYRELSMRDASKEMSWNRLRDIKDKKEVISVKISGVNKGGLLTNIDNLQAFLPVSQLSSEHYPRVADGDKQKILRELQKFIGKTLEVKIIDAIPEESKLIVSERAKSEDNAKEILKNYQKGDIIDGQISGIADFGVFVRFPLKDKKEETENEEQSKGEYHVEGMIHISELDWQPVENPSEIVKIGDYVKAQIVEITNNQAFLSLKSLKENPWQEIEKKYKKGDIFAGRIIRIGEFGAFVEIAPKIRGLCHLSEFESQKEMNELLRAGETYNFEILSIDVDKRKIGLKLAK